MKINEKIHNLRINLGLSRHQFAKPLGITGAHLYKIESGRRRVTLSMLQKISKIYEIPMKDLID
jgi:transcriptional regulator with XRE-family HTH domain